MRKSRPMSKSATVPATLYVLFAPGSGWDMGLFPQFHIQSAAIEEIVGVERDDLAFGGDEMDAGALHRRHAEVVLVEELHNHDAKDLVVAEIVRHFDLRQATKQVAEYRLRSLAGRRQRKQVEQPALQFGVALERDRKSTRLNSSHPSTSYA